MAKRRAAEVAAFNEKLRLEEEKRKQDALDAAERAIKKAEEDRVAEIKRKTKPHFQVNRFLRKETTDDGTEYYGQWLGAGGHYESKAVKMFGDAWIPHGLGEHRTKGRVCVYVCVCVCVCVCMCVCVCVCVCVCPRVSTTSAGKAAHLAQLFQVCHALPVRERNRWRQLCKQVDPGEKASLSCKEE